MVGARTIRQRGQAREPQPGHSAKRSAWLSLFVCLLSVLVAGKLIAGAVVLSDGDCPTRWILSLCKVVSRKVRARAEVWPVVFFNFFSSCLA